MNRLNFNTEKRNFKHLSEYERGEKLTLPELEALYYDLISKDYIR